MITSSAPYAGLQCMAVSHTSGSTWKQLGLVGPGKNAAGIRGSFGVSPRLAFGAQPASVAVMTVGSAGKGYGPNGYPGAGIYLWANALDTSSSSRADASLQGAWTS